jgi:hypothetical protein
MIKDIKIKLTSEEMMGIVCKYFGGEAKGMCYDKEEEVFNVVIKKDLCSNNDYVIPYNPCYPQITYYQTTTTAS